jgi:hypothetical protein
MRWNAKAAQFQPCGSVKQEMLDHGLCTAPPAISTLCALCVSASLRFKIFATAVELSFAPSQGRPESAIDK